MYITETQEKILLIHIFINGLNGNIKCNAESIKLKKKMWSKLYAKLGYLDIFIIQVKILNKKLKVFDLHVIHK